MAVEQFENLKTASAYSESYSLIKLGIEQEHTRKRPKFGNV